MINIAWINVDNIMKVGEYSYYANYNKYIIISHIETLVPLYFTEWRRFIVGLVFLLYLV